MTGVGSTLKEGSGCVALRMVDRRFTAAGRLAAEMILSLDWTRTPVVATDAEDATAARTKRTGIFTTRRISQ
jgi:hypothetical protein